VTKKNGYLNIPKYSEERKIFLKMMYIVPETKTTTTTTTKSEK